MTLTKHLYYQRLKVLIEKILFKLRRIKKPSQKKESFTKNEYSFMNSMSAAILEEVPSRLTNILYFWLISIFVFSVWASYAKIDEITKGDGEVIPYGDNQILQNLEGGIVKELLVRQGQKVEKGQILIKLTNSKSDSSFKSNEIKKYELQVKVMRLFAEANDQPFNPPKANSSIEIKIKNNEIKLYNSDKNEFKSQDRIIVEQIEQKKHEYLETKQKVKHLENSLALVDEEIAMTLPMVKDGVKSKVDFLKLQREAIATEQDLDSSKLLLPSQYSTILEFREKRVENKLKFQNEINEELNEINAELERIKENSLALGDTVSRTMITSPVTGVVQKLYVHTIGGVVKPGQDLIEIVPTDDKLYLEVKIKPNDIAFIHPGAIAKVKFSAYDYAIYGGLEGKVVSISPDTITDAKDNTFYKIFILTDKDYIGHKSKPMQIIPGMTVSVDIVTGEKSIMAYILKPILKSKEHLFTER
ncbi:MAG: HlyD family type I secretion periplasmic adaptor subunit [Helicobacteraceae bacterium]|nr:HlyD family type I secretion periplasmic adaptor subunit [Helicobacteraceae bacterium]